METREKQAVATKKIWETMTLEERSRRIAKMHEGRNKRWGSMSQKRRIEHSKMMNKHRWAEKK